MKLNLKALDTMLDEVTQLRWMARHAVVAWAQVVATGFTQLC
ncbi:hypothetical protein VCHC56A1_3261 [Vibrio cholerae HC-56A1]|nr:hypothetical protein VCHC56A1_3261 [Vibrio cholerae HC-56A1]